MATKLTSPVTPLATCTSMPRCCFSSTSARSKCGSGSQANLASHVPKACAHVLLGMAVTFEVAVLAIESNAMEAVGGGGGGVEHNTVTKLCQGVHSAVVATCT